MVRPGKILVSVAQVWVPQQGVFAPPEVIEATVGEAEDVKFRADDTAKIVRFGAGDTVFIRANAGEQFVLDGQLVAAVDANDIIYHKVKK